MRLFQSTAAFLAFLCMTGAMWQATPAPKSGSKGPAATAPPVSARVEYEVAYHHVIRNKTDAELKDVVVYLPVPQSDAYQDIADFRLELDGPWEVTNRTDEFGAQIKRVTIPTLAAKGEMEVGFSCRVMLAPPVQVEVKAPPATSSMPTGLYAIPKDIRERYTRDHNIFGLANPVIKDAASEFQKKYPEAASRARAIHDFVASTVKYKSGEGWDSAPQVLARKSGSCSEFAYVFCALCRATGIPTRFVGASIFPAASKTPFQDHGHHRWAQAYLPGLGWVDFDPTLDAGEPAKQTFVGTHHGRTLVVTRTGDKSQQLGLSYLGSNSNSGSLSRSMWFTWSQGTMTMLADARASLEGGDPIKGRALLREIVESQPGTRAAREAAELLRPKAATKLP